jgi:hypothetical protein
MLEVELRPQSFLMIFGGFELKVICELLVRAEFSEPQTKRGLTAERRDIFHGSPPCEWKVYASIKLVERLAPLYDRSVRLYIGLVPILTTADLPDGRLDKGSFVPSTSAEP